MTPIVVTSEKVAVKFTVELTPDQAMDLYAELYHCFPDKISRTDFPTLARFYDALHLAEVPGS